MKETIGALIILGLCFIFFLQMGIISADEITIISPTNITYNQSEINFELNMTENITYCWYNLNDKGTTTFTSPELINLGSGNYSVTFFCNDLDYNLYNDSINFIVDYDLSNNVCDSINEFIIEHYNESLDYLVFEFMELKEETNLTIEELKDYLINYEEKCERELPFEDYDTKVNEIKEKQLKDKIYDQLKLIFKDPKYFLGSTVVVCLALFGIKSIRNKK